MLKITHLYPNKLNLYGDTGNILALTKRLEWRGIKYKVHHATPGKKLEPGQTDIYFMGGGQDQDQLDVVQDFLSTKAKAVKQDTENGVIFFAVCGGYQLLGNTFLMGGGKVVPGLKVLNIETKAPSTDVKTRCIGNLVVEIDKDIYKEMQEMYVPKPNAEIPKTLVGFENHSGQTFLTKDIKPIGKPLFGKGNNISGDTEGSWYKNIYGCYLHGSCLPKNPHFADYLIYKATGKKLTPLEDTEELEAHKTIVKRFTKDL